jgi:hypothetical protein
VEIIYSTLRSAVHWKIVESAHRILKDLSGICDGISFDYHNRFMFSILADAVNRHCFDYGANITIDILDHNSKTIRIVCQPAFPMEYFCIRIGYDEIKTTSIIYGVMDS